MNKIVLKYGLISGLAMVAVFVLSFLVLPPKPENYALGEVLGYSGILLSLSAVFFGILSYRRTEGGGKISFGRGLGIGLLISVVAGLMVGIFTWIYVTSMDPSFTETYYNYYMENLRNSQEPPEVIQAEMARMESMKGLMSNGWFQGLVMMGTVVMLGAVVSVIAAFVFRRK